MLGICHSESSFPYLHGAVRSWANPQEGVPGLIQLKHIAVTVTCCHGWQWKVLLGDRPSEAAMAPGGSHFSPRLC